jgi:hypothetical protein
MSIPSVCLLFRYELSLLDYLPLNSHRFERILARMAKLSSREMSTHKQLFTKYLNKNGAKIN